MASNLVPPILVISNSRLDEITTWVESLSVEQRNELVSLLENDWKSLSKRVGITKDWIEEHGGKRGWWVNLHPSTYIS